MMIVIIVISIIVIIYIYIYIHNLYAYIYIYTNLHTQHVYYNLTCEDKKITILGSTGSIGTRGKYYTPLSLAFPLLPCDIVR